MEFRVLGPLEVVENGRPRELTGKQRALLAVLLIHVDRVVAQDRLIDLLWGDAPPNQASKTLHYHVSKLRDALHPDRAKGDEGVIVTRPPGYVLELSSGSVDAADFEIKVQEARSMPDPAMTLKLLDDALALWRGDAYAEFAYEEFAQEEIRRLGQLRFGAEMDRFEALIATGGEEDALPQLEASTLEHPGWERPWSLLMTGLYRAGRQADALHAFQRARLELAERGLEPSQELTRLEERILLRDPALVPAAVTPHNLPAAVASLVGREEDAGTVAALVTQHRLVTLVGPAGIGKTRLAIEVAWRSLARYPDGVRFVELAPLQTADPGEIARAAVMSIGVPESHAALDATEQLTRALLGKRVLLVIDNCEHVIEPVVELLASLLARVDGVRVLATSRELLRISGEAVFSVQPLAVPPSGQPVDLDRIDTFPGLDLFCQRAAAVAPAFCLTPETVPAVVRLCAELDGMPLALELAASRSRTLSAQGMLDRLDERLSLLSSRTRSTSPRHRSLDAAIAWSYDLLAPASQALFARLSVFSGGCSLDAVEAVAVGGPVDAGAVVDILEDLVDTSMITAHPVGGDLRYGMHRLLRHFAHGQLVRSGEAEVLLDAHAEYFRGWAADHGGLLRWPQSAAEVDEWLAEDANLWAAMEHFVASGRLGAAYEMTADTWRFWGVSGGSAVGLRWVERLLAARAPEGLVGVRVLNGAGGLAHAAGDYLAAQEHYSRAASLARTGSGLDTQRLLVSAVLNLGDTFAKQGDYATAIRLTAEGLELAERIGHPHLNTAYGNQVWNLLAIDDLATAAARLPDTSGLETYGGYTAWLQAIVQWLRGERADAEARLAKHLESSRGLTPAMADGHLVAALLARDRAQPREALTHLATSLPLAVRSGSAEMADLDYFAWWLRTATTVFADLRRFELAARLAGSADRAQEDSPGVAPGWMLRDLERHCDQVRAQMEEQHFQRTWEEGRRLDVDEACKLVLRAVAELDQPEN